MKLGEIRRKSDRVVTVSLAMKNVSSSTFALPSLTTEKQKYKRKKESNLKQFITIIVIMSIGRRDKDPWL